MTEAFLSQSWYRVAKLKPALGAHVTVHRHRYRDGAWYVLEDAVTGKVHRLSPAAYAIAGRLDGLLTVDEIWTEVARLLDDAAPTQDETITLLAQLHGSDLLRADAAPDIAELDERRGKQSRAIHRQNALNPMSVRVPLFDPDRLLGMLAAVLRPLIGPFGLVIWAAVVGPAVVLAGQNWRALTENLPDRVFSAGNLATVLLVYPALKLVHELGHGVVAKRYGTAVHEFGLLLLVFIPSPYVDVSGSAAFSSRWRRAAVAAAGIVVETFVAAVAFYAWLLLEPGWLRSICFDLMLVAGVSTVLANGNPLLRFDGYYVLCDVLNVPNLAQRANRYWKRLVDADVFGLDDARKVVATAGEKLLFLFYAPLAFAYRIALTATIAVFVANTYFVLGAAIAVWMAVQTLALPLVKGVWAVVTGPSYRRKRFRAVAVMGGALAAAAALLFALPAPSWTSTLGVVWLPETAQVRAGASGFLKGYLAVPDSRVGPGARLVALEDPALDARIASLTARVRELSLRLAAHVVNDRVLAETTRIELDEARKQLEREQDRAGRMVTASAVAGRFVTANPAADGPGRYFKEGDLIGYVLPEQATTVRTVVGQDAIDLVRGPSRGVELRAVSGWTADTAIQRAVPSGQFELPSAALGLAAGGTTPTDVRDSEGRRALARVFQFDVAYSPEDKSAVFGHRAWVKFHHDPEPVGVQVYRRARQLFLASFGA